MQWNHKINYFVVDVTFLEMPLMMLVIVIRTYFLLEYE